MDNPELKHTDKFGNHKFDETKEYGEDLFLPTADRVTAETDKTPPNGTLAMIKASLASLTNKTAGKLAAAQGPPKPNPEQADAKSLLPGSEQPRAYMLKGIPSYLSPDVLHCLAEAGWQEEIVIADSTFPVAHFAGDKDKVRRVDGTPLVPLVEAVMDLLTLAQAEPLVLMKKDQSKELTNTQQTVFKVIAEAEKSCGRVMSIADAVQLNRKDFLARAKQAKVIVITGDPGPWNSLILRKGLIGESCGRVNVLTDPVLPGTAPGGGNGQLSPLRLRNLAGGGDQEQQQQPSPAPPGGGSEAPTTHSQLDMSQHGHNVADLNPALNILRGKNAELQPAGGGGDGPRVGILPEKGADAGPGGKGGGKVPGQVFSFLDGVNGKNNPPQAPAGNGQPDNPPDKLPALRVQQIHTKQDYSMQGNPSYRLAVNPMYQYEGDSNAAEPSH